MNEPELTGRERKIRNVLLIEGLGNIVVFVLKLVAGFGTGSSAILSDALHSATDVANNVLALFVVRVAATPPDADHPYGHHKFETLAVFVLAVLLSVMAVEIAIRALTREDAVIVHSTWALGLMIGVLLFNVGIATWQHYWARRLHSDLLRADAQHTLGDVMTTIVVIVGWQIAARGFPILDTIFALAVAALVLYLAFGLFRRAIPTLVDQAGADPAALVDAIGSMTGVHEVHRVRSRVTGSATAADVIIRVSPELSTKEAHLIADAVEKRLEDEFDIPDVIVHIEPQQ